MQYIRLTHRIQLKCDIGQEIMLMPLCYCFRCKLFYMKNKEFAEKGLGMLYLKKVADNDNKTQLVLRAETNLGNILLNIMLTKQMNLEKRKNCVQFVCIPNPEIPGIEAGSPVTMLVKVKNVDQASILEDEMKKRIDII